MTEQSHSLGTHTQTKPALNERHTHPYVLSGTTHRARTWKQPTCPDRGMDSNCVADIYNGLVLMISFNKISSSGYFLIQLSIQHGILGTHWVPGHQLSVGDTARNKQEKVPALGGPHILQ